MSIATVIVLSRLAGDDDALPDLAPRWSSRSAGGVPVPASPLRAALRPVAPSGGRRPSCGASPRAAARSSGLCCGRGLGRAPGSLQAAPRLPVEALQGSSRRQAASSASACCLLRRRPPPRLRSLRQRTPPPRQAPPRPEPPRPGAPRPESPRRVSSGVCSSFCCSLRLFVCHQTLSSCSRSIPRSLRDGQQPGDVAAHRVDPRGVLQLAGGVLEAQAELPPRASAGSARPARRPSGCGPRRPS